MALYSRQESLFPVESRPRSVLFAFLCTVPVFTSKVRMGFFFVWPRFCVVAPHDLFDVFVLGSEGGPCMNVADVTVV